MCFLRLGEYKFNMHSADIPSNAVLLSTNTKFVITHITNIRCYLENFIALYELAGSELCDVILNPEKNPSNEMEYVDGVSINP